MHYIKMQENGVFTVVWLWNCKQSNTVWWNSARMCWCKLHVWFSTARAGTHGEWCPRKCSARQWVLPSQLFHCTEIQVSI